MLLLNSDEIFTTKKSKKKYQFIKIHDQIEYIKKNVIKVFRKMQIMIKLHNCSIQT